MYALAYNFNMPMFKKRRVATGRRSRPLKRSYAMVPRPMLNREKAHRHIVTCATSTTAVVPRLAIYADSGGLPYWNNVTLNSPNMSLSFSLAAMLVNIGGVLAETIPLPNANEFEALYDTFQIEKVEVTIFFGKTESAIEGTAGTPNPAGYNYTMPLIGYAPDTDDAGSTSNLQLQQYSTYKVHQANTPLRITVVPCTAAALYDPVVAVSPVKLGFSRVQKQDVNTQYPATPHYGVKFCVDSMKGGPGDYLTLFSVQARVHLLMKSTR